MNVLGEKIKKLISLLFLNLLNVPPGNFKIIHVVRIPFLFLSIGIKG